MNPHTHASTDAPEATALAAAGKADPGIVTCDA